MPISLAQHMPRADGLTAVSGESLQSPSLSGSAGMELPAYELKVLLTEAQALEVRQRVGARLALDPHADPALGGAYHTSSLYCDTPGFDVYHRLGSCKRRKHRLRRYDRAPWVFLERKTKWGDRVKKRRSTVPYAEMAQLAQPLSLTTWQGHWFHRHLWRRQLRPVCTIAYERVALMGKMADGPMRLTFDRHIRGALNTEWSLEPLQDSVPLLTGQVICEFKYQSFLPALFKEIIQAMRLAPTPVSKYRTLLRAQGFAEKGRAVDV